MCKMKTKKNKELFAKNSEINTKKSDSVPFWTAFGWSTVDSNNKPNYIESKCPYNNDITYFVTGNSAAVFNGLGALKGLRSFEPDEPDEVNGINYYYNCFGENIGRFVDWGSTYFTILGDTYNPNEWCTEVVIGDTITSIDKYAFYGLDSIKRVTIKGKNTVIAGNEIPKNVTICAHSDSIAKEYAQQNGNPFEKLTNPFFEFLTRLIRIKR